MAPRAIPNTTHATPLGEDPVLWLRLIRSRRVGAISFHRLVGEYGGVEAALDALPHRARAAGIEGYEPAPLASLRAELEAGRRAGARLLLFGAPDYPAALMSLTDAPPLLWVRGDSSLLNRLSLALIGARNASSLGLRMARHLSQSLGQSGFVIVSGLARGIDAAVQREALGSGTVAVQAGGVDVIYPPENQLLAADILREGCLISEQPMGLVPQAGHFPPRNRIVSGLSCAVVVVEATARSGSLITAQMALDQGREVLAVPGHPFDPRAAGCNQLIRDGAVLVRGAGDVTTALSQYLSDQLPYVADETASGPSEPKQRQSGALSAIAAGPAPARGRDRDMDMDAAVPRPLRPPPPPLRQALLERLVGAPAAEDLLMRDLQVSAARLSVEILRLEIEGAIERQPGGMIRRIAV